MDSVIAGLAPIPPGPQDPDPEPDLDPPKKPEEKLAPGAASEGEPAGG